MSSGGAREGAGRKSSVPGKKRKTFLSVAATEEQAEKIKEDAKKAGKTTSSYLLDLAMKQGDQDENSGKN